MDGQRLGLWRWGNQQEEEAPWAEAGPEKAWRGHPRQKGPRTHTYTHTRDQMGALLGGTQCGPSPGPAMEQGVEKVTRSMV